MTTSKARSKPCRHCLFTNNHLGTATRAAEEKAAIAMGIHEHFYCHEHSAKTLCNGFCRKYPERVPQETVFSNANGDLKAKYAHMSRQQLDSCGNDYIGYGRD